MAIFICSVCGHIEFGKAPDKCPVCMSPREKYAQNDNVFIESEEKSKEAAIKHIPSITINKECKLIPELSCADIIVRIGKAIHPMEAAHYIRFIDCYVDDAYVSRVMLSPGVFAGACFHLKTKGNKVRIVENCNIHGYWQLEGQL
ncbi:MAG: desulfoferrodoxin family protein [Chitinispirillaceae bacterium]|jgi:desulfoferrodoxin-like iron-binding protein